MSAVTFRVNKGLSDRRLRGAWRLQRVTLATVQGEAVALDEFLRDGINGLRGQAFLHQTRLPLAHATADKSVPDDNTDGMDCEAGVYFT